VQEEEAQAAIVSLIRGHLTATRASVLLAFALGLLFLLPSAATANPITDENARPGTPGWELGHASAPRIEGYVSKTSVAAGETIGFHVSTNPPVNYRINIYRLGWYGGAGARLMQCLPNCSGSLAGVARSTPDPNPETGLIEAGWPQSASLTVPSDWTTGEYIAQFELLEGPQDGLARYYPFVVRSATPADILVMVPHLTYLAYNRWGGTSAYENVTSEMGDFPPSMHSHAYKVSFDRPDFLRREWRRYDLPLLRFLEREGYDVSYLSETDVDANPSSLLQHKAVIVSGHSEYWTTAMRNGFESARDQGVDLVFMGANDAYWHVRFEDSSCPPDDTVCTTPGVGDRRTMVIYKEEEVGDSEDPISDPSQQTILFRDLDRPECELMGGVMYGSEFLNDGYEDYTTTAAGAADPWSAGSGLTEGSMLVGLMGFEFDHFWPDCDVPGTPKILFTYDDPMTPEHDAAAVRYTAPSGARVFSSGSLQFPWGLDDYRWSTTLFPPGAIPTNPGVQQFTRNMLAEMAPPDLPAAPSAPSETKKKCKKGAKKVKGKCKCKKGFKKVKGKGKCRKKKSGRR
jgi:hypothetical protein